MKRTQKNLLSSITLLSFVLLSTGCAPKNSDGTYRSVYSYHPYNHYNHSNYQRVSTQRFNHRIPNRLANNIESVAKSLLGVDYQYGATGPNHYDCSGFTKYVFSKQGINLPRISRDQAKVGQFIRANQLQKGDLIFFDSKKSSAVSHVGIYLGDGAFIHASSTKDKVVISNLHSNYYSKHFKWGRRVRSVNYVMR